MQFQGQGCVGLCQSGPPGTYPTRPTHRGTPPCPLSGQRRRRQDLAWGFWGQSSLGRPAKPRNSRRARGGNFSGRNGAVERASHEDISTIFLPTSLMPHSHRLPPFSTLITTVLFPPLRFFAIWYSPSSQLPLGSHPVKVAASFPPSHTRPSPVGTQPHRSHLGFTPGLTR